MRFTELEIPGVWILEPELHVDERGVFRRHFCSDEFRAHGLDPAMPQGNLSENPHRGTLRGFHYQKAPHEEAKTMSCVTGAIYDIVVDLRPQSPTFLKWVSTHISAEDRRSLHVPTGCANAWLTTEPNTTIHYYMSSTYAPKYARGIRFDDPAFDFEWPFEPEVVADKDRQFPLFDRDALIRGD